MTRYHVWLNGLGLQDIDPSIFITDVQEHCPEQLITTTARASGNGLHLLRRARQSLSVVVRFAIREYQPARRSAILQKVRAWARQGGSLTASQRPGQRLLVCPGDPSALSALRWTEELTLTFTTRQIPYWEDDLPSQITASGSTLTLPGDASDAPMDLRWRCSITGKVTLDIATPLSSITFRDLPVSTGQELIISHDSGVLTATIDSNDVLPFRTPESSDDLLLACGQGNAVSVTVNGSPAQGVTLSARGRWL